MSPVQLEQLYQEIILDHYRAPHHHGLRVPFDAQVHHVNPTCGDEVTLRIRLAGAGPDAVVDDVSYEGLGCSISQASTSVLTDLVIGRTVSRALDTLGEFTAMVTSRGTVAGDDDVLGDAVAFAGVARYPARVKCALLGWLAFKDAAAQVIAATEADGLVAGNAVGDNTGPDNTAPDKTVPDDAVPDDAVHATKE